MPRCPRQGEDRGRRRGDGRRDRPAGAPGAGSADRRERRLRGRGRRPKHPREERRLRLRRRQGRVWRPREGRYRGPDEGRAHGAGECGERGGASGDDGRLRRREAGEEGQGRPSGHAAGRHGWWHGRHGRHDVTV